MTHDPTGHASPGDDPAPLDRAAIRRLGHDLNNVMTTIQGYAEILLEEMGDSAPHRGDLELLHKATRRASTIVRDLMAVSR